ncbi:hypothetical protein EVG20_g6967 [Dentipellis fragilis]|uniref:Methyltransferase domain-containing protein n=1 Tax=Dentipellis fragilis TaxID=205917 RepID=A0A4Y9YJQ7_9AGAM|nr:hypothetical protein EVG20_g6967 [Dentipellis fragilis]
MQTVALAQLQTARPCSALIPSPSSPSFFPIPLLLSPSISARSVLRPSSHPPSLTPTNRHRPPRMSLKSHEQVHHDRINLVRLVRRLEKTVETAKWVHGQERDTFIKAQSMSEKLKYARKLLKSVELYDEMEVSSDFRVRHAELRKTIDRLENIVESVKERIAPDDDEERPEPILPTIPLPPLSARTLEAPQPASEPTDTPVDSAAPQLPEADLLLHAPPLDEHPDNPFFPFAERDLRIDVPPGALYFPLDYVPDAGEVLAGPTAAAPVPTEDDHGEAPYSLPPIAAGASTDEGLGLVDGGEGPLYDVHRGARARRFLPWHVARSWATSLPPASPHPFPPSALPTSTQSADDFEQDNDDEDIGANEDVDMDTCSSSDVEDDADASTTSSGLTEIRPYEFPDYFAKHNGRLFHSHGTSPYPLPVDGPEWKRLDAMHVLLRLLTGANYDGPVPAVLATERPKVVDLCNGTGKWVMEMAHEFPHAEFRGLDLGTYATIPHTFPNFLDRIFFRFISDVRITKSCATPGPPRYAYPMLRTVLILPAVIFVPAGHCAQAEGPLPQAAVMLAPPLPSFAPVGPDLHGFEFGFGFQTFVAHRNAIPLAERPLRDSRRPRALALCRRVRRRRACAASDYPHILREAARVLRPGGLLLFADWGAYPALHPAHPGAPLPATARFSAVWRAVLEDSGSVPLATRMPAMIRATRAFGEPHEQRRAIPLGRPWPVPYPPQPLPAYTPDAYRLHESRLERPHYDQHPASISYHQSPSPSAAQNEQYPHEYHGYPGAQYAYPMQYQNAHHPHPEPPLAEFPPHGLAFAGLVAAQLVGAFANALVAGLQHRRRRGGGGVEIMGVGDVDVDVGRPVPDAGGAGCCHERRYIVAGIFGWFEAVI